MQDDSQFDSPAGGLPTTAGSLQTSPSNAEVGDTCPEDLEESGSQAGSPPKSLRRAINAYCKYCTYDPLCGGGTWRQQVEACTVTQCPLWPVRPLSDKRVRKSPGDKEGEATWDE